MFYCIIASEASTPIQKVVKLFAEHHSLPVTAKPCIKRILTLVDKKISENVVEANNTLTDHPPPHSLSTCPPSDELLKQLQLAKYENETLRAHLANELGKLKQENEELMRKLKEVPTTAEVPTTESVRELSPLNQPSPLETPNISAQTIQPNQTVLSDEMVKVFSSIPKALDTFYTQMEQGTENLPKFSELPAEYRKNRRTKGAYSKRKAIYAFISNSGGIEECLHNYPGLSPLQIYEQHIKKTRESRS